jgi:hypothetical protein
MSVVILVLVMMTSHNILDFVHEVRHSDKLVIKEVLMQSVEKQKG